jgi:outer membrane lipoprotein-sorting protein
MQPLARVLWALVVFTPFAAAQDDPLQLVKKVAATYSALYKTSYDFEQVEVMEVSGAAQSRTEWRRRIVGSGGRYREETLPSGIMYLFDGQYSWAYNPDRNEYTKDARAQNASGGAFPSRAPGLGIFEIAGVRAKSARLLRQETLELASGPVVCQVIEVEREPAAGRPPELPRTYWIDPGRNLALKLSYKLTSTAAGTTTTTGTISFSKAVVGGAVDESLLRFMPPADAVQVARLSFGTKSTLVGQDEPDFELKSTDGKPISSASLRGRALLLQFTGAANEDALLFLEMMHRSLKSNGLTTICVLPPLAYRNFNKAYTVPVAIDPDRSVAKKFGFTYAGMVLIDGRGKIVYASEAGRNSADLARALQAAGVW